jgi:hypothetical protein
MGKDVEPAWTAALRLDGQLLYLHSNTGGENNRPLTPHKQLCVC